MRRWFLLPVLLLAAGGCTGSVDGRLVVGDPPLAPDAGPAPVSLAFVAPAAGASYPREVVTDSGELGAAIAVEIAVAGAPARVELHRGDLAVGVLDGSGHASITLVDPGPVTLTATAFDAGGAVVATAEVPLEVVEPEVADCHAWLDLYGLAWETGPAQLGVADPVTVTTPINGVAYRYVSNTAPRSTFFMDCALARSLARAAPILRARGVVEVADIGVYNYRCIGGGQPPCERGLSQHAQAMGIDLAGFTDQDGVFSSVNDDWVIDGADDRTCAAATEPGKDAFLHQLICALKAERVWNVTLTPNYNADHRNHFHVDLTPGSDFLRSYRGVDDGPDRH
jgi:hypothetical protein